MRLNSQQGQEFLRFATASRLALWPIQAPYPMGTRHYSPGVKMVCEADHSSLSSAKVKNMWTCTSTSPYIFMVWCLVKHIICLYGMVLSHAQGQLCLYHSFRLCSDELLDD
jgi:hypothetical protein